MSIRALWLVLSLAITGCATTSEDVEQNCPRPPEPPESMMEPVEADFLKRVNEWLYE